MGIVEQAKTTVIVVIIISSPFCTDKALDKSKLKYQRSFLDWEVAEGQYTRADTDKEVSRNEVGTVY